MNNSPQTLKGFRDILPTEKRTRDWVQYRITESFKLFGFEPLETPTLEYADLLLGKYGSEADKLVYTFEDRGGRQVGLRYDQTVPTARVLGQYQNDLPKYFRRYQIQNVFRADKPQKGRYREFTQCDIDIFGTNSPVSDAEIIACAFQAYSNIGFNNLNIQLNTRANLISSITPFLSDTLSAESIIQTIDKLDKLSQEEVIQELVAKGLDFESAKSCLTTLLNQPISDDLQNLFNLAIDLGVPQDNLQYNPSLARGLDYYTGMIFEVNIDEYQAGSLGGGGRYDNLIADLTSQSVPAVGMAFGFDRTVEAAKQLGLIPEQNSTSTVLVTLMDENSTSNSLQIISQLRQAGISSELYPQTDNLGKQFKLANQKNIPFVIVIGDEEMAQNKVTLKDLKTGDQELLTLDKVISILSK